MNVDSVSHQSYQSAGKECMNDVVSRQSGSNGQHTVSVIDVSERQLIATGCNYSNIRSDSALNRSINFVAGALVLMGQAGLGLGQTMMDYTMLDMEDPIDGIEYGSGVGMNQTTMGMNQTTMGMNQTTGVGVAPFSDDSGISNGGIAGLTFVSVGTALIIGGCYLHNRSKKSEEPTPPDNVQKVEDQKGQEECQSRIEKVNPSEKQAGEGLKKMQAQTLIEMTNKDSSPSETV